MDDGRTTTDDDDPRVNFPRPSLFFPGQKRDRGLLTPGSKRQKKGRFNKGGGVEGLLKTVYSAVHPILPPVKEAFISGCYGQTLRALCGIRIKHIVLPRCLLPLPSIGSDESGDICDRERPIEGRRTGWVGLVWWQRKCRKKILKWKVTLGIAPEYSSEQSGRREMTQYTSDIATKFELTRRNFHCLYTQSRPPHHTIRAFFAWGPNLAAVVTATHLATRLLHRCY